MRRMASRRRGEDNPGEERAELGKVELEKLSLKFFFFEIKRNHGIFIEFS